MKKFIALVALLLIISPSFASAQSVSELQAQISSLLALVAKLQAQIAAQSGGGTTAWCHTFNTDLQIGSSGAEVTALQTALQKQGVGAEKYWTSGTFDENTASAVSSFQQKYRNEILTPAGLSNGSGYVGARTRAKMNALYGCGSVIPPTNPPIPVLSQINLKTDARYGDNTNTSAFLTASIAGNSQNRTVSYWKLRIACGSGVTADDNMCEKERRVDIYSIANPEQDYLFLTFSVFNKSNTNSYLTLTLTAHDANGNTLGTDKESITLSGVATSQPSITVLSPNGGEKFNTESLGFSISRGVFTASWKSNNESVNLYLTDPNGNVLQNLGDNLSGTSLTVYVNSNWVQKDVNVFKLKACLYKNPSICDSSDNQFSFVSAYVAPIQDLTITTSSQLPNAKVGQPYSVALNISGGSGSYLRTGEASFPVPGLGFSSSYGNPMYITGTPLKVYINGVEQTTPSTFTFNTTITSGTKSVTKQFTLTVDPAATTQLFPNISSVSPSSGFETDLITIYGSNFTSSGYNPAVVFSNSSGYEVGRIPFVSLSSISDTKITFTGGLVAANLGPGTYKLSVVNSAVKSNNSVDFTIKSNSTVAPKITITSPNGGEQWQSGSTQTIKWSDSLFTSTSHYIVFITQANGGAYGIAANDVYGQNYFNWKVGEVMNGNQQKTLSPGSAYYIQVVRQYTNTYPNNDQSDGAFSIVSAPVTNSSLNSCVTNTATGATYSGYYYYPGKDVMVSNYCLSAYDTCSSPTYTINGVNYWFRRGGKDTATCQSFGPLSDANQGSSNQMANVLSSVSTILQNILNSLSH